MVGGVNNGWAVAMSLLGYERGAQRQRTRSSSRPNLAGHQPGPDAAITKLTWSEYHRAATELAVDILGTEALTPTGRKPSSIFGPDEVGALNSSRSWVEIMENARAGTIYAGSSEVQRNMFSHHSRAADPVPDRGCDQRVAHANLGQGLISRPGQGVSWP